MNIPGKLVIIMGSMGSGKGVLTDYARTLHPEFVYPPSCTTREMRAGDREGDQYYFISREEFEQRVAAGDFLEWAHFGENLYGSLKKEILPPLHEGKTLLLELDVQGVRNIKQILPSERIITIFIDSGSWDELERRARARAPISETELAKRKQRYEDEITFKKEATYVVQNPTGKLDEAKKQIEAIMNSL
jgi:guanylate kinase